MATFTNNSKSSSVSASNQARSSVSHKNYIKSGQAQKYDDSDLTYDELLHPVTNQPVFYDSVGKTPTITNETKS